MSNPADPIANRLHAMLTSGVNLAQRLIYVGGEIDGQVAYRFAASLHFLEQLSDEPILIHLNSPGGSEPDGFAMYDAIQNSPNEIIIHGYGLVASIASLIFVGGDQRLMAPHCRFMIHNGSVDAGDTVQVDQLMGLGKEVAESTKNYHTALAKRSGLSVKRIADYCVKETYFSAKECVKLGFAHGILKGS